MQKPFNKVEGWKTEDGKFHETEDVARTHSLRLIINQHRSAFDERMANEIAGHGQWLFDTMSDLGYKRSVEAAELPAVEKSNHEKIREGLIAIGIVHADVIAREKPSAAKVDVTIYDIKGVFSDETASAVMAIIEAIVPAYVNITVKYAPMSLERQNHGIVMRQEQWE